jgi:hypothetical protein
MVRATPEDAAQLRAQAEGCGVTVPAYLLACALRRRLRSQGHALVTEELRRLGLQQRELCTAAGGALSAEYGAVLLAIIAAVRRLGN